MNSESDRKNISTVWKQAAKSLSVRIETPYDLESKAGERIPCIAYLPDFGSPSGMVFDILCGISLDTNYAVKVVAADKGFFCSFINPKIYEKYDAAVYKEALVDWGYFGEQEARPKWLSE